MRLFSRFLSILLLLSSGLAAWWIVQEPIPAPSPSISSQGQSTSETVGSNEPAVITWEKLSQYKSLKLQAPLYPPEVKPVVVQPPPPMTVNVQLLGIVLEKDRKQAMVSTPQGSIRFVGEGDFLDQANQQKIAIIEKDHIVVTQGDQTKTLSLEQIR